jgi:hypothetical protein
MEPKDRIKTVAIGAMSAAKTQMGGEAGEKPTLAVVDAQTVEAIIADWPAISKSGANEIIKKYGPPTKRSPVGSSGTTTGRGNAPSSIEMKYLTTSRIPTRTLSSRLSIITCRQKWSASWRNSMAVSSWNGRREKCGRGVTWKRPTL